MLYLDSLEIQLDKLTFILPNMLLFYSVFQTKSWAIPFTKANNIELQKFE